MIVAEEKIKQRIADAAAEPAPIPLAELYSERELFLRQKFLGTKPRGATPGPMDLEAKSSWEKEIDKTYRKKQPTPVNHSLRNEKGEK